MTPRNRLSASDRLKIKSIVDDLDAETLALLRNPETPVVSLKGKVVPLGDASAFFTEEGLLSQVDTFEGPCGLIYYVSNRRTMEKMGISLQPLKDSQ